MVKRTTSHMHTKEKKHRRKIISVTTTKPRSTSYFTTTELKQFETLIREKQGEVIETIQQGKATILEEREQRNFGLHRENGSEEMDRAIAVTLLQKTGEYGVALLNAEKRMRFSLNLQQLAIEKRKKSHDMIEPISVEELFSVAQQKDYLSHTLRNVGIFGVCRECHEVINKNRIFTVPHTTLCCECKNKLGSINKR